MKVYLDNAATTPLDKEVFDAMAPFMLNQFGNPSSIHSHGREVRAAIERSRKKVAELLNTSPSEIFFTSGGTEADNTAIRCTVAAKGIQHIISSKIEHHAVLHTIEHLEKKGLIQAHYLTLDEKGHIDLAELEGLLKTLPKVLITLMHANNEIGNLNDIVRIGELAKEYGAVFHSDTVQTMGHYVHDLQQIKAHCLVGAAHKFHGPKGVGFLYLNAEHKIQPFIYGGAQERNMRGGTENVYGIIGLAKALEIAYRDMDEHRKHVESLKARMIAKLKEDISRVGFNGDSANMERSLYTVLNVCLPPHEDNDMLLFNLDINGISASGGSACSSGSSIGSHVLAGIKADPTRGAVRFSFSRMSTEAEIDYAVEKLAEIYGVTQKA
ncbi:cysteine desulfurase family protein [Cytophagales bacterium LB-30]|uniref:Cysteine desulfurase family protein n=1 Tax=Shiella aurantiaca TaxID=3058365 RepID=A0ABT8F5M0_9BACT|nr:cysteine desulfurase family protein [Shiella aurantiaca]MDN4165549.1 cysteine desulfurase family protein [Shiella aurantiaca]